MKSTSFLAVIYSTFSLAFQCHVVAINTVPIGVIRRFKTRQ